MLSSKISEVRGAEGLPEGTIKVTFHGSAGQSFGGWLAPGVQFDLLGDANDYTGKGLSGGVLVVRPPEGITFDPESNQLIGNTVLYGATRGRAFFRGLAGERFAVRNSGAHAVIEGVGDHGCEYMTGGRVVVLGPTGRNFAAGMSGGIAYVYDRHGALSDNLNTEMVELERLDDDDVDWLRRMLVAHVDATDSAVGQRVLSDWESELKHFVKVMPRDYRSVLAAIAEAERNGEDVDTAIMAAARG
jgi:glutamate synthase (NADPH/NADH) large chain